MSLKPEIIPPVPEETARIARAAFPKGNRYMMMRDIFGTFYQDEDFSPIFPTRGQPGLAPWRLALVTVMQFAEGLSDRQAAEAVQARIDWKYALSLELADTGFDASVLSEFRSRLVEHEAGQVLLDVLLETFKASGLLKARGKQRTDSTHVLAAIRSLNRLECVGETLRFVLNTLSSSLPDWLQAFAPADWYVQYGQRFEAQRLPQGQAEQIALAEQIGRDGVLLVEALAAGAQPVDGESREALRILHRVWLQNYFYDEQGQLRWRDDEALPPSSLLLRSPYDPEARAGKKRSTTWIGYKVHVTETCDADAPHLIVHVDTTPATAADYEQVDIIHTALQTAQLMPKTHLVDAGYVDALNLLTSQQVYQVNLLGPLHRIGSGRLANKPATTSASSISTGKPKPPAVRKAKPTSPGVRPQRDTAIRHWSFVSVPKIAKAVPSERCVLTTASMDASYMYVPRQNMKCCNSVAASKRPTILKPRTDCVPELRARSLKPYVSPIYAARATSA